MMTDPLVDRALAEARPVVFWLDRPEHPEPAPPLSADLEADLVVVGGGFTGLWTAVTAAEADPGRSIVVLEADTVAFGASGRNGGFCDASLTHGLENGIAHWPDEIDTLIRLGNENLHGLLDVVARHSIDCSPEPTGALDVAVALEDQRRSHDVVEKRTIVRDEKDRAPVADEKLLQQLERLDIQVVGRLVEHQQVRGLCE
ncbi:MAG: FAD-binding oxidoreductase [Vicinamibacterales bacterium]|nr:FAD-binding oxidoreductase [Vicinamibacterales bacterium]